MTRSFYSDCHVFDYWQIRFSIWPNLPCATSHTLFCFLLFLFDIDSCCRIHRTTIRFLYIFLPIDCLSFLFLLLFLGREKPSKSQEFPLCWHVSRQREVAVFFLIIIRKTCCYWLSHVRLTNTIRPRHKYYISIVYGFGRFCPQHSPYTFLTPFSIHHPDQ